MPRSEGLQSSEVVVGVARSLHCSETNHVTYRYCCCVTEWHILPTGGIWPVLRGGAVGRGVITYVVDALTCSCSFLFSIVLERQAVVIVHVFDVPGQLARVAICVIV